MTEEFWWPSLEAFDDLSVEEIEDGFAFIAPDDTECGAWLAYFNETPERQEIFSAALIESIKEQIERVNNGETKELTDGQQD
jgi:isopropylmalate/homocitrate/citramalate synthase